MKRTARMLCGLLTVELLTLSQVAVAYAAPGVNLARAFVSTNHLRCFAFFFRSRENAVGNSAVSLLIMSSPPQ